MQVSKTLAGLLLVGISCGSQAATVSYTGTYSGGTDVTNQVINVAQFNPVLGTLVSATFELSATMTTSASFSGDASYYVGWDKSTYQLSLQGDTGYTGVAISDSLAATRVIGTGTPDGSWTLAEYLLVAGPNYGQAGPTLTESNSFIESPLAAYIGAGNLNFFLTTLNYDTLALLGAGSPSSASVATDILGQVKVTYEYNVVPVPAAVWMLGSALGLLGFVRRQAAS
jgi:hypothetical protein